MSAWRPLRRRLSDEAITHMDAQRAAGQTPLPIHMMLVDDDDNERARSGCGGGLGEWVTGDSGQVTCAPCLEVAHA